MNISHMHFIALSDVGLIALLKAPWAEILPLIGLIGQLNKYGNMGKMFDDHIRYVLRLLSYSGVIVLLKPL